MGEHVLGAKLWVGTTRCSNEKDTDCILKALDTASPLRCAVMQSIKELHGGGLGSAMAHFLPLQNELGVLGIA